MLPLHVNSLRPARIAPSAANKLFLFSSAGVSPLFVALPYVSVVSPLSTAFTHSDRGGRVRPFPTFRRSDLPTFRLSDLQTCRLSFPTCRSLSFHRLTSCPSRNSCIFITICVAGGGPCQTLLQHSAIAVTSSHRAALGPL